MKAIYFKISIGADNFKFLAKDMIDFSQDKT